LSDYDHFVTQSFDFDIPETEVYVPI